MVAPDLTTEMASVTFAFYNLAPAGDPDRGPLFVDRELNAIGNLRPRDKRRHAPLVIGYCEGVDRKVPKLDGYRHYGSNKNRSRQNVGLYVHDSLRQTGKTVWWDGEETWPRVLHDGIHEARSTLWVHVEGWRIGVGHAPQGPTDKADTEDARAEWLDYHAWSMSLQSSPTILLSDPNALGDDLHARVPKSKVTGTAIEAANAVWVDLTSRTPAVINGVPMLSDHKKALLGKATAK